MVGVGLACGREMGARRTAVVASAREAVDVVDAALQIHQLVVAQQKLELATRLGRLIAQLPQHVLQRNRGVATVENVADLHDRHGPA